MTSQELEQVDKQMDAMQETVEFKMSMADIELEKAIENYTNLHGDVKMQSRVKEIVDDLVGRPTSKDWADLQRETERMDKRYE